MVKFCQQREEEYDTIINDYEKMNTLNSSWEVSIAYFGTIELYNDVTEKYGYQKIFPNDEETLYMPNDVYKILRDQDKDDELFDAIYEENIE
jgi:hypothetical protein